jgi:hypothetical protein
LISVTIIFLLLVTIFSIPYHISPQRIRKEQAPSSWSQPIPIYLNKREEPRTLTPAYEHRVTHDGDLVLDGFQSLYIENCTYFLNGELLAEDNSSLTLKNAQLIVKQKNEWSYPGDIVPFPYIIVFQDSSQLNIINSSVFYEESFVNIGLFNRSKAIIRCSDTSCVWITAKDNSELVIAGSQVGWLGAVQEASCNVSTSTIDTLWPDPNEPGEPFKPGAHVNVKDSKIGRLYLLFNGSKIILTEPLSRHMERFSVEEDLCRGCEAFWVTLENTDVDSYFIYAYESKVRLENQTLGSLLVTGSLWMSDSTCTNLYVGRGVFHVVDSVMRLFIPHWDTFLIMERSNVGTVHLHSFTGTVIFHKVQTEVLFGHTSEGFLRGDLHVLKETAFSWFGEMRLKREYHVLVEEDDYAVEGAELRLLGDDGEVVWSGASGFGGEAWFSLTYCNMLEVSKYHYVSNYTVTRVLVAENNGATLNQTISISSSTPILFSFTK